MISGPTSFQKLFSELAKGIDTAEWILAASQHELCQDIFGWAVIRPARYQILEASKEACIRTLSNREACKRPKRPDSEPSIPSKARLLLQAAETKASQKGTSDV